MSRPVYVAGVGMAPFVLAAQSPSYLDMAGRAVNAALTDAGLAPAQVGQAYAGSVHGAPLSGQAALAGLGLRGLPVVNVANACATGATALFLARQAVAGGMVDCALALGFEQLLSGPSDAGPDPRPAPLARYVATMDAHQGLDPSVPQEAQFLGGAAREYLRHYGIRPDTFARIAVKARQHAARNPMAPFRATLTLDEVMASPTVFFPLTQLQCSQPTCGAAAVLLCSEAFARRHARTARVRIAAQALRTDTEASFETGDMRALVGFETTRAAARQVYEAAGIGPEDVDVVELHDSFTAAELLAYEALGLVAQGGAERFILDGDNSYGGQVVTNPSGGLLSRGHPPGATGLAQCVELTWQLRGQAEQRQVEGARLALQHNLGLGGACVVTLYQAA